MDVAQLRLQQVTIAAINKYTSIVGIFAYVFHLLIRVDHSRVREVGPDRAAAEWVLRLGGTVKFRDFEFWSSDYNRLPSEPREKMRLEAINASGVAITDNGLEHLSMSEPALLVLGVQRTSTCFI